MKSSSLCQIGAAEQSCWSLLMFLIDFSNPIVQKKAIRWAGVKYSGKLQKIVASLCCTLSPALCCYVCLPKWFVPFWNSVGTTRQAWRKFGMAASSSVTESPISPSAFFTRVLTWSLRRPPWLNPVSNQLLSLPTRSTWRWSATTRPTRRWQPALATTASPTSSTAWWSAPPAAPSASSWVPRQTGSWAATWKYSRCCECLILNSFYNNVILTMGGLFPQACCLKHLWRASTWL